MKNPNYKLTKINLIDDLEPNDRIWRLADGEDDVCILTYVMPHPKVPTYSVMIEGDAECKNFDNADLQKRPYYRYDGCDECWIDIFNAMRERALQKVAYYTNKIKEINERK